MAELKPISIQDISRTPASNGVYRLITDSYWAASEDGHAFMNARYGVYLCNKNRQIIESYIAGKTNPYITKMVFIQRAWLEVE